MRHEIHMHFVDGDARAGLDRLAAGTTPGDVLSLGSRLPRTGRGTRMDHGGKSNGMPTV